MANQVCFSGKVNFEPNIIPLKDGKNMAAFSMGVYNGKDPNGKSKYMNVRCKVFGERYVDGLMNLTVPANLIVVGRLECKPYTDKNGVTHNDFEVNCETVGVEL